MTSKSRQIEVTEMGKAAVVRFTRTECLMWSSNPRQDVGEDLFALVDPDHYSSIVIDFENPDIPQLSGAFLALSVTLNYRLFKANGVLKLCNLPETIMEQFQVNQLVKVFKVFPDLEAALKSDP